MLQQDNIKLETEKAINNALDLIKTSIDNVEKVTHIQLENSRNVLESVTSTLKNLSTLKDPKEVLAKLTEATSAVVEKGAVSAHNIYDVLNDTVAKLNKLAEDGLTATQEATLSSVDSLTKSNPAVSKAATHMVQSWIDNTNQVLAATNKVVTQFTELTNKNLDAATEATINAINKVTKK
ncbi:MAG: phasin family protein [Burkholderiales bacterium]|nr:phasin family protein [Burkholderiales bacterium]